MTKSLSTANTSSIASEFLNPNVLVEMTGISKKWSSKSKSGYERGIVNVSPIRVSTSPLGGVSQLSDFDVVLRQEAATQFFQDNEVSGEPIEIYLQFGSQEKIPLIKGEVDRWVFSQGRVTLECLSNIELEDAEIGTDRITASDYSTYKLSEAEAGAFVPVTLGDHDTAFGRVLDLTYGSQKVAFNPLVTGHAGVSNVTHLKAWHGQVVRFGIGWRFTVTPATANGDGFVQFPSIGSANNGHFHSYVEISPNDAEWDDPVGSIFDTADASNAVDEDGTTFATARPVLAASGDVYLRCQLPDFSFSDAARIDSLYLMLTCDRQGVTLNAGETVTVAAEPSDDTWPSDTTLHYIAMTTGDSEFDNIYDRDVSLVSDAFLINGYQLNFGIDSDDDGTKDTLPPSRLSKRNFTLEYTADSTTSGPNGTKFRVWELRLLFRALIDAEQQEYYGDLEGFADDSAGTYTGTPGGLIERPADLCWFVLEQLAGASSTDALGFRNARFDLGKCGLAGQVLEPRPAREVLDEIAVEGRMRLFVDENDEWTAQAITFPAESDEELRQDQSDFVTSDGSHEGEIVSVTQSSRGELYNRFEVLYKWNEATSTFEASVEIDEDTDGPAGDWCAASQSKYGVTRKKTFRAKWIRTERYARTFAHHLIMVLADRKRVVTWRTAFNQAHREVGDRVQLTHVDVQGAESTVVYAGYRDPDTNQVIESGYLTSGTTIVAGENVELGAGRHIYDVLEAQIEPMTGVMTFTGRQADTERAPLPIACNPVECESNDDGSLQRISQGFIYEDDFDDLSNWTTQVGTWSVASNELSISDSASGAEIFVTSGVPIGSEFVVQAGMLRGDFDDPLLYLLALTNDGQQGWYGGGLNEILNALGPGINITLIEDTGGNRSLLDDTTGTTWSPDNWTTGKAWLTSGTQRMWTTDGGYDFAASSSDTTFATRQGRVGLGSNGDDVTDKAKFRQFKVYSTNTVTILGVPSGYAVRAIYDSPSAGQPNTGWTSPSGGTVEINLKGRMCAMDELQVQDAGATTVATYRPSEPTGVWGGDIYQFDPAGGLCG